MRPAILIALLASLVGLTDARPTPEGSLNARDDPTAGRAPHQPYMHGYNATTIKTWSAATDPNAKYLRSRVPLAARIPAFSATQAKPQLATGPQVLDLSYDYDNSFFTAYKYNDDFARRQSRFWQYSDLYGSWHGMPIAQSPTNEPVHGLINLPNPAWTDAAHRNGVRSLGCWFWPRPGQFKDYLEQRADGSFPVADKLIEMAAYFGFDGYFVNQEASISSADAKKLMEMIQYWRSKAPKGFHIQWYDTILTDGSLAYQNQLNEKNVPWLKNGDKLGVTSIFPNYWMPNDAQVQTSVATAKKYGLDPYQTVFTGTENEKYGFNPAYDPRHIFPEGQPARTAWGLFGSHFVWDRVADHANPDAKVQDGIFKRERQYWSGPNEDPSHTGRTEYVAWDDDGVGQDQDNQKKWDGVAHYITERSVIGGFPFVTRFNTGRGRSFALNGTAAGSTAWNNAAVQDVLPTWQWWAQSSDSSKPLSVDYDYGLAYDGGNSLRVSGNIGSGATTLRLFKTQLNLANGQERVRVTFTPGTAAAGIELGLVLSDSPTAFTWVKLGQTTSAGGAWVAATQSLATWKGKTVAAVALRFSSKQQGAFQVNVGEVAFLNGAGAAPAAPQGFKVDTSHVSGSTAEVFLSWTIAPGVWYYDITRDRDGKRESVGRIYDDVYYVKSLGRAGGEAKTTLRLEAVSPDGSRSQAATTTVSW